MTEVRRDRPLAAQRLRRAPALDGLRGVAALIVVMNHVVLSIPALTGPEYGHFHASGWAWWVTDTPLEILWNGGDAVIVFFALSGFVLVVRPIRDRAAWLAYYPARLVRLYLPVFVSVLIALAWATAVHAWVPLSADSVLRDMVVVRGVDLLNAPLWSLQWEVIFSVLLPLYVAFAWFRPGWWAPKIVLLLAVIAVGAHSGRLELLLLPEFALGAILAVDHRRGTTRRFLDRLDHRGRVQLAVAVGFVALVTIESRALLASDVEPGRAALITSAVLVAAGAALVVALVLHCPPVGSLLCRPTAQWLGARSFSLYLVHYPIVRSVRHLTDGLAGGTADFVAIPLSLLAAELFFRSIERPSHHLAQSIAASVRAVEPAPPGRDHDALRQ